MGVFRYMEVTDMDNPRQRLKYRISLHMTASQSVQEGPDLYDFQDIAAEKNYL